MKNRATVIAVAAVTGDRGTNTTSQRPEPRAEPGEHYAGKGAEVSALATSTDKTGVEKGEAVSTLASGGRSRAGEGTRGASSDHPTPSPDQHSGGHAYGHTGTPPTSGRSDEKRPVEVPNKGAAGSTHRH